MPLAEVGRLQVAEDYAFQRRDWRVQRVAWVGIALIIAGGLAGAFGSGPLSSARKSAEAGLFSIRYDRFVHWEGPGRLRISYSARAPREGSVRIALDARYLEKFQILHIEPQPQKVESDAGHLTYVFAAAASPGVVTFEVRFREAGPAHGAVSIAGVRLPFSQFVYP